MIKSDNTTFAIYARKISFPDGGERGRLGRDRHFGTGWRGRRAGKALDGETTWDDAPASVAAHRPMVIQREIASATLSTGEVGHAHKHDVGAV